MKLGVCLEMVFENLRFADRIARAADLGFAYGEMWHTDEAVKGGPEELAALAEKHGVTITSAVAGAPGGTAALTNPAVRKEWLQHVEKSLDYTKRAAIPNAIVCTGDTVEGMSEAETMQSVLDGLAEAVRLAETAGVTLLLEPLNTKVDHPGQWLDGSDKGADICRKIGSPRLKLLYDCYHMQIMEGDLVGHLEANLDVIGHIHAAGHPGRHELWLGEINYPFLVKALEDMGYDGVFALEYAPSMDDEESLRRTREHLGL